MDAVREFVWAVNEAGLLRLYRIKGPWAYPEQFLTHPCVVEEYPTMALFADQCTVSQTVPRFVSQNGQPVQGRVVVLGVLPETRELVPLTRKESERLALVSVPGQLWPRYLRVLPG